MKILIDIDDVVWNLLDHWIEVLNRTYDLTVSVDDINQWDIKPFFPTLTEKQIYEPLNYESFWQGVKVKEDAVEYIEQLNKYHDIYFVTATHPRNIGIKYNLLTKYFPFINYNQFIVCQDKTMVKGDVLIDDKIDNLKDRRFGILYSTFHTKEVDLTQYSEHIIRFNTWKQIYLFIETLKYISTK